MTIKKVFSILCLFWILSYVFAHFCWLKIDERPLGWDESHHMIIASQYLERVKSGNVFELLAPANLNYPPFYHWSLMPVLNFFPTNSDIIIFLNLFYLGILFLSVYFLSYELIQKIYPEQQHKKSSSILAAILSISFPTIFYNAHYPMLDVPLSAWVCFSFLCLIRCQNFSNKKWSILLGFGWGGWLYNYRTCFFKTSSEKAVFYSSFVDSFSLFILERNT